MLLKIEHDDQSDKATLVPRDDVSTDRTQGFDFRPLNEDQKRELTSSLTIKGKMILTSVAVSGNSSAPSAA